MSQKIFNGFPQFFSYTYQAGKYFGTPITQGLESHTDINTQSQLVGDSIEVNETQALLISVYRDGAFLHESQGYEIIGPNMIRVFPGLLDAETLEIKKFVGASGVVEIIPTIPPVMDASGFPHSINEATIYTDNSTPPVNAFGAIVLAGKTRLTTEFSLDEGRIDVYVNGFRASINDAIWTLVDNNTIELNDNYSAVKMKVDIIKQKVG